LIDNILKLVGHWKLIKNNMKRFITMPSRWFVFCTKLKVKWYKVY
jgi:hypothetical protein